MVSFARFVVGPRNLRPPILNVSVVDYLRSTSALVWISLLIQIG